MAIVVQAFQLSFKFSRTSQDNCADLPDGHLLLSSSYVALLSGQR